MPERFEPEKSLDRQIRAFHWVRLLAELPDRSAGSAGEREAAERVEGWLREVGFDDVTRHAVPSRPRGGAVAALHLGLGAFACWLGGTLGVGLALLAAISFRRELRTGAPLLSRLLPRADSLDVAARAGAARPRQRLVLSAHLDTGQAGWIFPRLAARGRPGPDALFEGLLLGAAAALLVAWLGAAGFLVEAARFALGVSLLFGFGAALQWARAESAPGANTNASGVAAMLTCAEQLVAQLPDDTELWVVGTGAREVGLCGMRAFSDAHPDWRTDRTWFVNFESVGGGELHWVRSEGAVLRTVYPPAARELARRVAASGAFGEVTAADLRAETDGRVPAERDFPTLSLISLEANGTPRNLRCAEDLPEAVDMPTVVRAADFAAAVAQVALRGEAAPIAIV